MRSYQVMFCNYTVFPDQKSFVSRFSLRDETGKELCDAAGIIFVELSKLDPVIEKGVADMTGLEAWSVFFATAHKPEYKRLIIELTKAKEVVSMANDLLLNISQDEREQAHARSRRIFERDMEHNFAVERKEGRAEGIAVGRAEGIAVGKAEGKAEGIAEGIAVGIAEGKAEGIASLIKNMLANGLSASDIAKITGLSIEEIEEL